MARNSNITKHFHIHIDRVVDAGDVEFCFFYFDLHALLLLKQRG